MLAAKRTINAEEKESLKKLGAEFYRASKLPLEERRGPLLQVWEKLKKLKDEYGKPIVNDKLLSQWEHEGEAYASLVSGASSSIGQRLDRLAGSP